MKNYIILCGLIASCLLTASIYFLLNQSFIVWFITLIFGISFTSEFLYLNRSVKK